MRSNQKVQMRIKSVELKNFKRFTHLTISDIPEGAKLVLLIGSNGSGKSCVFDAFGSLKNHVDFDPTYKSYEDGKYFRKDVEKEFIIDIETDKPERIHTHGKLMIKSGEEWVKKFIGRSSIRIIPRINIEAGNTKLIANDGDSPFSFIENDTRFMNDLYMYVQEIDQALREPIFRGQAADTLKIFRDFIEPFNTSLINVFGGDENTTIQIAEFQNATVDKPAKLIFKKGEAKINYDLLSHGEKQVVILLLNFIVRREFYNDCIIYIDEMDCHLNTKLQSSLIEEIVNRWIPDNSQLWTASHALGFIDFARKNDNAIIIDFDLFNFDQRIDLVPSTSDRLEVYEVAIPRTTIASILTGYKLVVVENQNDQYFNLALGEDHFLFLPANNNREVFLTLKSDGEKLGLRDKDYLRVDEIESIKAKHPNMRVLKFYTFENYLYHPDNIESLGLPEFDKSEYIKSITDQKEEKKIYIIGEVGKSRSHYIEFKDCIMNDNNIKPIIDSLNSLNFEEFYAYFNMKKHYSRAWLQKYKLTNKQLCQTQWFREQIKELLC